MKQVYPLIIASKLPVTVKAIIFSTAAFFTLSASAQSLNLNTTQLIKGGDGQKAAGQHFDKVLGEVQGNAMSDCIVGINEISSGVQLKSLDSAKKSESVEWNATKTESIKNIVIEKSVDGIEFTAISMEMMAIQNIDGYYYCADQTITPSAHEVYYRLRMIKENGQDEYSAVRKVEFAEQRSQVEMQLSTKIVSDKLSIHLPLNWKSKEVVFELFNDNGEIIQKVIEHKSSTMEVLEMKPLAAGSYLIKASCGTEFAQQTVIHTEQL